VSAPASPSESITSPSLSPSIPATALTGTILFARAGGTFADETVFTASASGTQDRRITPIGAQCCPRWSPDGAHILISASGPNGRITVGIIDRNGSHERKIPLPDRTLNLGPGAWSPDGTRIAFEGWDDATSGRNGIYTARAADGGDLVRVTHTASGSPDGIPMDYSPDGSQIVLLRPEPGSEDPVGPLFVVNLDGSGLHRITPPGTDAAYTARWSADGAWILFAGPYWLDPGGPVWAVHPDGTGLRKVFADDSGGLAAATPTWSPDGRMILFGLGASTGDVHSPNDLCVILANGGHLTTVIAGPDLKREPDWVTAR
jgi:Tol biopolymer transport system component